MISELPLTPLFFDASADDLEAEWWRICRDAYERLGWGFKKSTTYANTAAADAGHDITRSPTTVGKKAKAEQWAKAAEAAVTADERRAQTAPAREAKRQNWIERRTEAANRQADIVFSCLDEMDRWFSLTDRRFIKSQGARGVTYDDGTNELQKLATVMGIATDKADKLMQPLAGAAEEPEYETREEKMARLEPMFEKVRQRLEEDRAQ